MCNRLHVRALIHHARALIHHAKIVPRILRVEGFEFRVLGHACRRGARHRIRACQRCCCIRLHLYAQCICNVSKQPTLGNRCEDASMDRGCSLRHAYTNIYIYTYNTHTHTHTQHTGSTRMDRILANAMRNLHATHTGTSQCGCEDARMLRIFANLRGYIIARHCSCTRETGREETRGERERVGPKIIVVGAELGVWRAETWERAADTCPEARPHPQQSPCAGHTEKFQKLQKTKKAKAL
jgi:hypothetical protein